MQKTLIIIGAIFIIIGISWPWLSQLPFGKLPGDILIRKESFTFYFPITSMVIASLVLSLVFWIFRQ